MNKHLSFSFLKKSFYSFICFSIFINAHHLSAQYNLQNLTLVEQENNSYFRYKNLQLFPVVANKVFLEKHKNIGNYTVLQQAIAKKQVRITEQSYRDKAANNTEYASISPTLEAESKQEIAKQKLQETNRYSRCVFRFAPRRSCGVTWAKWIGQDDNLLRNRGSDLPRRRSRQN